MPRRVALPAVTPSPLAVSSLQCTETRDKDQTVVGVDVYSHVS